MLKILAVGDSYLPIEVLQRGLSSLRGHQVAYLQINETMPFQPSTPSELSLREFVGNPAEIASHLEGCQVLVVHAAGVSDAVLKASPELRLVGCARGGPVNVDLQAASELGIPVLTAPGKNAEAVADLAIAFMIMLARRVIPARSFAANSADLGRSVLEGAGFIGHELSGKTLGLVGLGQVGRRVAIRARAFGMRVAAYDPFIQVIDQPIEPCAELDALLSGADFVSLHARATAENGGMMGRHEFMAMRPGSFFINTARETLVDEAALDEALASRHLAGAALDLVKPAAVPGPHPLLRHENLIITPHIGGSTDEALLRGVAMIAEDIARFAEGKPLQHAIGPRPRAGAEAESSHA